MAGIPPEFAPYFALLEVGALVQHGVEQQVRDEGGISFVQFQILAGLDESPDGSRTMTEIADQMVHSRSGLTYQAQKLEEAGYLTRGPAPGDERSTVATLTPAGREVLARVLPGHMAVVADILEPLSPPDAVELTRLLDLVRTRMRARPPRSAVRRSRK
ncbi:MarR family transcriptional regulator [Kineosporia sp. J2-2]|uniref:MarR family transcriptional regulator n=1 Tax=Kineosporia corallincola TaxID=2835133 RepID=A0ABS5TQ41_9ACTN|nr:MarR family transcriptional regulator [Kineosporia corallincola]MBT0773125.1 MarR family transcriptional regulator [Kineosporia corallincola]